MTDTHGPDCRWHKTTPADCEYRETHQYCPHEEHACTCAAHTDCAVDADSPPAQSNYIGYAEGGHTIGTATIDNRFCGGAFPMSAPTHADFLAAVEKETACLKEDTTCTPDVYVGSRAFLAAALGAAPTSDTAE